MAEHPIIGELRQALARHDDWPTTETKTVVIGCARALIQTIDMRAAVIEAMRQHVTPTDQAIAELLGDE
jgi:hypothetical protein